MKIGKPLKDQEVHIESRDRDNYGEPNFKEYSNKSLIKRNMKIFLIIILGFNIGCFKINTSDYREYPKDLGKTQDISLSDKKKAQLIETVLNLPSVIKFSKLKLIQEKYNNVYIILKRSDFNDSIPPIMQNGNRLMVLNSLDSLNTEEVPCYLFKMDIKNDTAFVNLFFGITGALAYGNLNYIKGHWVPDKNFVVGVR